MDDLLEEGEVDDVEPLIISDAESEGIVKNQTLPWVAYNKYFKVVGTTSNEKNFIVKCQLCVNSKNLSTSKISSSNLKKHIVVSTQAMPIPTCLVSDKC